MASLRERTTVHLRLVPLGRVTKIHIDRTMDPAEQLQRIYLAGFDIQTFDRFPAAVGVLKGNCIALLQPTPAGLSMIGAPAWKLGENLGVLTEVAGRKVFQHKEEIVQATPERVEELRAFTEELKLLLQPAA